MLKKVCTMVAAVLMVAVAMPAKAQFTLRQSVSLVFGIPTGDFGKNYDVNTAIPVMTRENIGSDAGIGIGLNYRAMTEFDVTVGTLNPFVEAGFMWNRVSKDNRDRFDDMRSDFPKYYNIPIMIGLQYCYDQLPIMVKPYAEFGIGTDLFIATHEGTKSSDDAIPYLTYKSTASLAWQIGIGAYIGGMVSAGFTYYGYGKHGMDYKKAEDYKDPLTNTVLTVSDLNAQAKYQHLGTIAFKVAFHF